MTATLDDIAKFYTDDCRVLPAGAPMIVGKECMYFELFLHALVWLTGKTISMGVGKIFLVFLMIVFSNTEVQLRGGHQTVSFKIIVFVLSNTFGRHLGI